MGYTNPCNDPQRAPMTPNEPQRAPITSNDQNYYSNGPQRPKLLLQRPPTIQNIIITSSNDPKDKYYPSIRIPYAFLEKFRERITYQNRYEVSKTYASLI